MMRVSQCFINVEALTAAILVGNGEYGDTTPVLRTGN